MNFTRIKNDQGLVLNDENIIDKCGKYFKHLLYKENTTYKNSF